jgi:hypothetical protein
MLYPAQTVEIWFLTMIWMENSFAASENARKPGFLANKNLNVKNQNKFYQFFYIPKGKAFIYIIKKINVVSLF